MFHDIGYLSNKFKLDVRRADITEKAKVEKLHVVAGAEMISNVSLLKNVMPIIRFHHKSYDGSVYIEGISADEILLGARIVALVEYIKELNVNCLDKTQIINLLRQNSSKKFDHHLVELAIKILSEEIQ